MDGLWCCRAAGVGSSADLTTPRRRHGEGSRFLRLNRLETAETVWSSVRAEGPRGQAARRLGRARPRRHGGTRDPDKAAAAHHMGFFGWSTPMGGWVRGPGVSQERGSCLQLEEASQLRACSDPLTWTSLRARPLLVITRRGLGNLGGTHVDVVDRATRGWTTVRHKSRSTGTTSAAAREKTRGTRGYVPVTWRVVRRFSSPRRPQPQF